MSSIDEWLEQRSNMKYPTYNSHIYYCVAGVNYEKLGKMCDSFKYNQTKEQHKKCIQDVKNNKNYIYMGAMFIRKAS